MKTFESVLEDIRNYKDVKQEDLLNYLCVESKEDRFYANLELARAYFDIKNYKKAQVFIQRAWLLSGFSKDILRLYVRIHEYLNDTAAIREAYKRSGIKLAGENKVIEALTCFNDWQNTDAVYNNIDNYYYDFDILECIKKMAAPYKFQLQQPEPVTGRKIRIAYLMFGMMHSNSVIVKLSHIFAKYHDKNLFDITFFVPESTDVLQQNKQSSEYIENIESQGWKVVIAPVCEKKEESLINLASLINENKPDILITNPVLADFVHYFIVSTGPAPIILTLTYGPPAQFVPPEADWSITTDKHIFLDSPVGCSLVDIQVDPPDESKIKTYSKEQLNIPENGIILTSAGRPSKLQSEEFWNVILDTLEKHPEAYFVAVGIN